jgi:uncharacterized repeat protein (TIGR02059 family)
LVNNTNYYVTFASGTVKDLAGNAYAGTSTYDFKTLDTLAPTVSTFSPADGSTGVVGTSNIVLTFSEAIQKGTGLIYLRIGSATGTIVEQFDAATSTRLTISGNSLTLDPTANLVNNTNYYVTFASGTVKDLAGNAYAGTSIYDFTTLDTIAPLFTSAVTSIDGLKLILTYGEVLSATTAAASAFTVKANGIAVTVAGVIVSGKTVELNLSPVIQKGQTVTVAYTDPSVANDSNAVQDAVGNDAVTLAATNVTNNSIVLLVGTSGADTLRGGIGNDTLTGLAGIDTFMVDSGTDTITDLGNGGAEVLIVASGATANAKITNVWTATASTLNNGTANITTNGLAVNLSAVTTGANGFTVTNTGVASTLTGSALADKLLGGAGNDTINAGNGDDSIIGSLGSDKLDGGLGNDTLDLIPLGYDLNNRGKDTYTVSGTAANFTINDNVNHLTTTVANVEKVKIGEVTVATADFLTANQVSVNGKDLITNPLNKNAPSIDAFLNTEPSYDHNYIDILRYVEKVDLSRLVSETWNQSLTYNPNAASNSLTFNSVEGSNLVYTDSLLNTVTTTGTTTTTVYNKTAAFSLTGSAPITDKFTGTDSIKRSATTNASQMTTGEAWDDAKSFSYVDSNGTFDVSDDIAITSSRTSKGNWANSYVGSSYSGITETDASTESLSYKGNGLSLNLSKSIARNSIAVWDANSKTSTTTKDIKVTTINQYAFADTLSSSLPFSISLKGNITKDEILNTEIYDFNTIALVNYDYSLTSANWLFISNLDQNGDGLLSTLNLGWSADQGSVEGAGSSINDLLVPLLLTADNTVTLKDQGVNFDAEAGNDSITGGKGNDTIDGGVGNDTINGGAGNDFIMASLGSDKLDGGAGTDTLDLTSLGYDLFNRGQNSYAVTGTAANFTITDNVTKAVTSIINVEKVRIGGEDISVNRFLTPDANFITALDALMAEEGSNNPPSVESVISTTRSAAGDFVDILRFGMEDWQGVEQVFKPDAVSTALTFTSASNSTVSINNTKSSTTGGISTAAAVKFNSGDAAVKFDGSYSDKTTYVKANNPTAGTTVANKAFTYSDTNGTTVTTDDIAASYTQANTYNYQTINGVYKYSDKGTVKQSYSANGYALALDSSYVSNYVSDSVGIKKDTKIDTVNSYSYSDSSIGFSLKASGTYTVDDVVCQEKLALKTVEWNDANFKISATNAVVINNYLSTDVASPTEHRLNFGVNQGDDLTAVHQNLLGYEEAVNGVAPNTNTGRYNASTDLLSAIIKTDNIIALKTNDFSDVYSGGMLQPEYIWRYGMQQVGFNAGAGNDSVTGTVGSDLICGGSGNDSILAGLGDDIILGSTGADILSGGSGIDTFLFASGDSGQSIGYDQILDFAKGKKGVGDIIRSNGPMSLQVGGLSSVIDSNHASINQKSGVASFAAGSGKTLSDALNDVANSTDQTGHFAFFKVANAGNYNLFISDGVQGVTSGDVVVQLIGLTSINTINTLEGLRIFD